MRILIYPVVIILTCSLAFAGDFVTQFERASAKRFSPGVELNFSALRVDSVPLDQRVADLSEAGFNSIVLKSIPAESSSWTLVTLIAELCRNHSMKLGCVFFLEESLQGGNTQRLQKLGWNKCVVDMHEYVTNRSSVCVSDRFDRSLVAHVFTPVANSNEYSTLKNIVVSHDSLPELGIWYDIQFFSSPVQPATVDYLNQELFTDSVNGFLLEAQQQLNRNYGSVLSWLWFPSISNSELVWSDGVTSWFAEHTTLDLIRHLPVLAGVDIQSDSYSRLIRQRYQQGIKRVWRERFAMNAKSLIQEAGLNAGVLVDEIPLDPEETGSLFGVTLLNSRLRGDARVCNRRAAGGARVFESKNVVGRVGTSSCRTLKSAVDTLLIDGADKILFDEGILGFKGCAEFATINDLIRYLRRIQLVLQNSKPQSSFLLCSEEIPKILNQYSFDCANLQMLRSAEVKDGLLNFASGSYYTTVVFSGSTLVSKRGKELAQRFTSKGVRVLYLDADSELKTQLPKDLIARVGIKRFGEIRNLPELLPDLSWSSDQSQIDIRFTHRSNPQRDFYLIKNESLESGVVTLTLKVSDFKKVFRWQPKAGRVYEISSFTRIDKFRTSISSPVRAGELLFIVFER